MSAETALLVNRPEWEIFFAAAELIPSMRHSTARLSVNLSRTVLSSAFAALESQLAAHRTKRAAIRRRTAPDFTVFDFIKPTENVLSDILRFFLDPAASHGQGDFFLHAMINQVRPDISVQSRGATVVREALTYSIPKNRRRIDLVATLSDFVLAIETKKFTGEGREQIQDYCQHLLNIAAGRPFCLLFLSRSGTEAASIAPELAKGYKQRNQLKSWSWERDVPDWLIECQARCESEKVRHFIDDFRGYIARYLAIQKELIEDHDAE